MFCGRKLNRKINHIHERALRFVYDDYTSTFESLLEKDKSVSIHHRNIHRVAIEMYKVINNLSPGIIQDLFQKRDISTLRIQTNTFIRPYVDTVYKGEDSLRNFGPIVWNKLLPNKFKSASTLEEFKKSIKLWVPKNCPCRLCKDFIPGIGYI